MGEKTDLTLEEARNHLNGVKQHCRGNDNSGTALDSEARETMLRFIHFKRLIRLLSELMRIDQQYIVSQMAWTKHNVFEMTDLLVATTMFKGSKKKFTILQAKNDALTD